MSFKVDAGTNIVRFESSNQSQLGKAVKWIWISALFAVVYLALTNKGSVSGLLIGSGVMILTMGAIHLTLRSQLKKERTSIILDSNGISCGGFSGSTKQFLWTQIASASIEVVGNAPILQLLLSPSSGLVDKKSFINGRNPSRPYFPLAPYSKEDQEEILDAIYSKLSLYANVPVSPPVTNVLRVEREFQDKLKAMAPRTWVTYALLSVNIVIWCAMIFMGADVLKPIPDILFQWGGNTAFAVQHGQWWRLLSASFLHAGIVHLVVNMFGLAVIGMTLERLFGHRLYLSIYLFSGVMGSALSMHFSAQTAVSVGASGAIFGVAGALLVAVFKNRKTLPQMFSKQTLSGMGFFVIYSLVQGFGRVGIDNAAHVGGLLAGCLMAALLTSRLDVVALAGSTRWRTPVALSLAALLILGLSLTSRPSEFDVQRAIEGSAAFATGTKSLADAEAALLQEQRDVKAGKLTERQADDRSRAVHAPAYKKISAQLASAWFLPGDHRNELLKEVRYAVVLMTEALAMESTFPEGTTAIEPADPVRRAFIDSELVKTNSRMQGLIQKMSLQKNGAKKQ